MRDHVPDSARVVHSYAEAFRLMGHATSGRSPMHQLWVGRPGTGKTTLVHRLVRNLAGHDEFPGREGRVEAPNYGGKVTPAKMFMRLWLHHLEALVVLNDVSIPRRSDEWDDLLTQALEREGERTVRWDLKIGCALTPADRKDFTDYLKDRRLLARFLEEQGDGGDEDGAGDEGRPAYRDSLPELDAYRDAYGDGDEDDMAAAQLVGRRRPELLLPGSFTTAATLVIIANRLGGPGWDRVYSRLGVFVFDPSVDEQLAEMRTWTGDKAVPGAVLEFIEACHRKHEVATLDFRAVRRAAKDLKLGERWEDALAAGFFTPADEEVQDDVQAIREWLEAQKAVPGEVLQLTEAKLVRDLGRFRGGRDSAGRMRLNAALGALERQGFLRRFLPPAKVRPGAKGARPRWSFEVLEPPTS